MRPPRPFTALLTGITVSTIALGGCAGSRSPCADPAAASSLSCLQERAREPAFRACIDDLFYERTLNRRERAAIADQYGYPATNAETYFALRQMGVQTPSPHQWCDEYAARRTALRIGSGSRPGG